MGANDPTITLHLNAIDELFNPPALDPMHGVFDARSGVDRVITELKAGKDPNPTQLAILLPQDEVTPDLANRVMSALRLYCDVRIDALEREVRAGRYLGRRELKYGIVFLAACLLLAGVVQAWDGRWEFLNDFVSEGLIIIGWIALWHPIDMLLFERWPMKREQRLLAHIQQMQVTISADR